MPYCLLQGRQICEGRCKLDLYFASEFISGCKLYIPRYKPDYEPPRTPLIPRQLPTGDHKDSSWRSSGEQPNSYLNKIDSIYYVHGRGIIIEDKKEETLEDKHMKVDVQVQ